MNTESGNRSIAIDMSAESRHCGACQLCCRLLPVRSLQKPRNTRCAHQRTAKGCTVYRTPRMPAECHIWSCRWLVDPAAAALRRPDRCHYVVDVMPDMITVERDGVRRDCLVVQIWVDPYYPAAHRDPALRAYLARIAEAERIPAIVRGGGDTALLLAAPCLGDGVRWIERSVVMTGTDRNRLVDRMTEVA